MKIAFLTIKSIIVINAYALKPNKEHILTISNYKKSTVGINTYTLTLNENPILTIFNYKKHHSNKCICINTK